MKRAFFALLAMSLAFAFVFACEPTKNENVNRNANANGSANQSIAPATVTDKIVQIFIHDDPAKPGYYEIEDPGSVTLHKKKNQKIVWCVIYDGSKPPSDVVIDNFRSPPPPAPATATNPFGDGSAADNTFNIPSTDFNACKKGSKTPKANVSLATYKYMITVKVNGADRGHLDPQVVIND